jgi:hypothetical protein
VPIWIGEGSADDVFPKPERDQDRKHLDDRHDQPLLYFVETAAATTDAYALTLMCRGVKRRGWGRRSHKTRRIITMNARDARAEF